MIPAKQHRPDLLILDGVYTICRAYYATPPLTNPAGLPTGAITGFLGATISAILEMQPRHVIMAGEGAHLAPDHREALSSDYKAQRKPFPTDLQQQIPLVFELCSYLGWQTITMPGFEADDVIGSYLKQRQVPTVVWTTDKDILACIHSQATIYQRTKGKGELLDTADITAKWGVPPHLIPEVLALFGDTVDNIPGVGGIGKSTAVKLVQQYGSVAGVLANQAALPPRVQQALVAGMDKLRVSQALLQINQNLVLPPDNPAIDKDAARALLDRLHMVTLKQRLEKLWTTYEN